MPWADAIVPVLIALATLIVFSGALHNGFVNWDDDKNFLTNPYWRGLGWAQLRWVFDFKTSVGHYQPLNRLAVCLGYVLWGMNPAGYHLFNLVLHALNAVLFYFISLRLLRLGFHDLNKTDDAAFSLASAFAALLFAIHPLRVEAVAWVSDADALCGVFYLAAILFYLRRSLVAAGLCYLLALSAKPMCLTMPVVLLILDVYPLRRLPAAPQQWLEPRNRPVWLEKIPFLALVFVASALDLASKHQLGLMPSHSVVFRIEQSFFGLAFYLAKTLAPVRLVPLYEIPADPNISLPTVVLSVGVVLALSVALIRWRRHWPAGLASWAYYIATLVPLLGIISFGPQLVADRYSYLACLPWPILAASGFSWAWQRANTWSRTSLCLGAGLALAGLSGLTWRQVRLWHDSETLWEYTIGVRPQTSLAHNNLGATLAGQGNLEEAVTHYREALRIKPDYAEAHSNWAAALAGQGRVEEATAHYREALWLKPNFPEAHSNWGVVLAGQGRVEEAIAHYREALRLKPDYAEAHNNWGIVLAGQGRVEEAIAHYREALQLKPNLSEAHNNWGVVLAGQGRVEEAIAHYREALRLKPDYVEAHNNLGMALAREGKLEEALRINPGLEPTRKNLDILRQKSGKP